MSYYTYDTHRGDGSGTGGIVFPRISPAVLAIIVASVGMFVVQVLLMAFAQRDLAKYLGVMPGAAIEKLYVWQFLTYMFLHSPFHLFHVIMNMLFLYWFGTQLERVLGRSRFLVLYLGGGVAGGLAYAATQYIFDIHIPAIGASAAVMALLVVYAIYFPNQVVLLFFFVPMAVKWFVLILIGIDLLYSMTAYADGVAHTAHLGGALFGFLYWRFSPRIAQFFARIEDRQREREAQRQAGDERRMDELLDKISREGFDSLTRGEREFLTEQSRRRRERGYRG